MFSIIPYIIQYLVYFKDTWRLFLNHSSNNIIILVKIRTSSKAEAIPPIMPDTLFFLDCFEFCWHSLSSNEEMLTVQLLSTLISTLCTRIVISFEIHCSISEIISELEALAAPCRRARKVTAWGEAEKQRNTPSVMFSWDNPHWQRWLMFDIIAAEISSILTLASSFCIHAIDSMARWLYRKDNDPTYDPFQTVLNFKQP